MKQYKLEATANINVEGHEIIKVPVTITFNAEDAFSASLEAGRLLKEAWLGWSYDKPEQEVI